MGRILENDMGIGATEPEGIDACTSRTLRWPFCQLLGDLHPVRERDLGIQSLEPVMSRVNANPENRCVSRDCTKDFEESTLAPPPELP